MPGPDDIATLKPTWNNCATCETVKMDEQGS